MGLLDGALASVFGAALGAVFGSGTLHKTVEADTGGGRFTPATTDYPVKLSLAALAAGDRAASGLPLTAVRLTVLRAGLPVTVDLDDGLTVGAGTFRVVKVDTDPVGAAYVLAAVPA